MSLWGSSYAVLMSMVWEFESKVNKLCTIAHKSSYILILFHTPHRPKSNNSDQSTNHDYNHIQGLWPKGNAGYIAIFHIMLESSSSKHLEFLAVSIRCLLYFVLCPIPRESQGQAITRICLIVIELLGTAWNYPMIPYEIWNVLVLLLLFVLSV